MLCGGYYAPEWSQREARYAFSLAMMALELEEEPLTCDTIERCVCGEADCPAAW
jgi:hypothetical protein